MKKIAVWVGIAVILALAIVGIAGVVQNRIQTPEVATNPVVNTPPTKTVEPPITLPSNQSPPASTPAVTNTTAAGTGTNTPGGGETPTPANGSAGADVALTNATDTDNDTFSDEEEAIMGTDATKGDTDGDTYQDGKEVVFLYSPNDPDAKRRIWETSAVNKYHHPVFNYELLYPAAWVARSGGENGSQIIFSSPGGEFVTVRVEKNPSRLAPAEWLNTQFPGQSTTTPTASRSGASGGQSATGLLTAFAFGPTADPLIVVIQYHGGGTGVATYRTLYQMMIASFQDPQKFFWPFSSVGLGATP